jgi:hypothetical protein
MDSSTDTHAGKTVLVLQEPIWGPIGSHLGRPRHSPLRVIHTIIGNFY